MQNGRNEGLLANPCPTAYFVYSEWFVLFVVYRETSLETVCDKSDSSFLFT